MNEKKAWENTVKMMQAPRATWGGHWSYNFRNDPKRLGFVLSRYKFAAKMGSKGRTVLELGCSEGIGAPILAEEAVHYTGVDLDKRAIESAQSHLSGEAFTWIYEDFMGATFGKFQTVVSLDVIEHVYPEHEALYLDAIVSNLDLEGMAIIGTPNITSAPYASKGSQLGHVNLFSHQRLRQVFEARFHNVFLFGMNDEILHTGFPSMAHYLICLACGPIPIQLQELDLGIKDE